MNCFTEIEKSENQDVRRMELKNAKWFIDLWQVKIHVPEHPKNRMKSQKERAGGSFVWKTAEAGFNTGKRIKTLTNQGSYNRWNLK